MQSTQSLKESPQLSRSNSSDSTDCGYASGSAGSTPVRLSPCQEKASEGCPPAPVVLVSKADGEAQHFEMRIRNTFLEMKDGLYPQGDRQVQSCPVSRMVSGCTEGMGEEAKELDICETSTEVWDQDLPNLELVKEAEEGKLYAAAPAVHHLHGPTATIPMQSQVIYNPGLVHVNSAPWMFSHPATPPAAVRHQVGSFSIPRTTTPLVAPPQLQAPTIQEVVAPPPPTQAPSFPDTKVKEDKELGSAQLPSVGSAGHEDGTCKPCAFVFKTNGKQGCGSGAQCNFCHLCPPGEKKRRRRQVQAA